MKASFNFLFVAIIGFLFLALVGLLETNKAKAELGVFKSAEDLLIKRWIVADAVETGSNRNLSEEFKAFSWQFMNSGGFVEFEEQLIDKTGNWTLRGQELLIRKEGQEKLEKYVIDKLSQHELLLSGTEVKIRLLRFND